MPLTLDLSHKLLIELAVLRKENKDIKYLRPDSKSQVTIEYSDDNVAQKIKTIVLDPNTMILTRKKSCSKIKSESHQF